jgi:hypothetical protein
MGSNDGLKAEKELQEVRFRLEEICIFLEEDLHNVTIQEEAVKLEFAVIIGEGYIAKGGHVCSCL